jgi:hypothetical protein
MSHRDQQMEEHRQLQNALKFVTTRRAAVLLGISEEELRRISHESGFGHTEVAGESEDTFFKQLDLTLCNATRPIFAMSLDVV